MFKINYLRVCILVFTCLVGFFNLWSATPVVAPNYGEKSLIGPLYFGPNAFPIPPVLKGINDSTLNVYIGADEQWGQVGRTEYGNAGERTSTIQAHLSIPLFTQRVTLNLWMPVMEFYENTNFGHGHGAGDVYVSTDIQILNQRQYVPAILLRAALKTASGDEYEKYRFYDSPGYFFDLAIAKSFTISPDWLIHIAGSAGFLCWQTDNGRQNDAVMYAIDAELRHRYWSLNAQYAGYTGWERIGDRPMVIRAAIYGHINNFEPLLGYEYGIRDYPFHTIRLGLRYKFSILKK